MLLFHRVLPSMPDNSLRGCVCMHTCMIIFFFLSDIPFSVAFLLKSNLWTLHPTPTLLPWTCKIHSDWFTGIIQDCCLLLFSNVQVLLKSILKNELGVHSDRHSTDGWQAKSFALFKFSLFTSVNHITENPQLPTYILPRLLVELTYYFKSWMTSSLHMRARTHTAVQSIAASCLSWVFCWYFSGSFSHSSM